MVRLAAVAACTALVAACGGSDFTTGAATLTGIQPTIKSSGANSFTQADGGGTMVLGWTLFFFSADVGSDCLSQDVKTVASIGVFTNQTPDATHKKAMLQTGDIVIAAMSPPTVSGNAAAVMGVAGISNIVGTVSITTFHLKPDGTADRIDGTVNAGGVDPMGGAGVSITGTFSAPICE
jgi:hypothetical protein